MKKLYQSEQYLRYSHKVALKALKRRIRRKAFLRSQRHRFHRKTREQVRELKDSERFEEHLYAPVDCRLLFNTESVLEFINRLEAARMARRTVFVKLKRVSEFDLGAIAMLLSVMAAFKQDRIGFNGDHPDNLSAKKIIKDSGFFEFIYGGKSGQIVGFIPGVAQQFVTHGKSKVDPHLLPPLMETTSRTLWGEKRINTGLTSVLMEMMQNTNNHASKDRPGEQQWWLSVNNDEARKKVTFCFVDHGIGVLASLGRKGAAGKWGAWQERVKKNLGAETDDDYIRLLLDGEIHATITGHAYRGKGIPNIKRMQKMGRISNLYVITNNVAGDVLQDRYRLLRHSFQGTFYSWELTEESFSKPWTLKM